MLFRLFLIFLFAGGFSAFGSEIPGFAEDTILDACPEESVAERMALLETSHLLVGHINSLIPEEAGEDFDINDIITSTQGSIHTIIGKMLLIDFLEDLPASFAEDYDSCAAFFRSAKKAPEYYLQAVLRSMDRFQQLTHELSFSVFMHRNDEEAGDLEERLQKLLNAPGKSL